MFLIQKTTPVKKNQPVMVAVSRGSSFKKPLNPTNYMFFESIFGEKSNGRDFKPVKPPTSRLKSFFGIKIDIFGVNLQKFI